MADLMRFDCRDAGAPADQFTAVYTASARLAAERYCEQFDRPAGEYEVIVVLRGIVSVPWRFLVRCEAIPVCFAKELR